MYLFSACAITLVCTYLQIAATVQAHFEIELMAGEGTVAAIPSSASLHSSKLALQPAQVSLLHMSKLQWCAFSLHQLCEIHSPSML